MLEPSRLTHARERKFGHLPTMRHPLNSLSQIQLLLTIAMPQVNIAHRLPPAPIAALNLSSLSLKYLRYHHILYYTYADNNNIQYHLWYINLYITRFYPTSLAMYNNLN